VDVAEQKNRKVIFTLSAEAKEKDYC